MDALIQDEIIQPESTKTKQKDEYEEVCKPLLKSFAKLNNIKFLDLCRLFWKIKL